MHNPLSASSRRVRLLLTLVLGVAVALFWALPGVSQLSFEEQYQLFLFSGSYLCQHLVLPGGLAAWVGAFITQFFYIPVVGAVLMAVLMMLVQRAVWRLCRVAGGGEESYGLSFLPVLLLWVAQTDENVMVAFTVALLVAMAFAEGLVRLWRVKRAATVVALVVTIPLFYWFFGTAVCLTCLFFVVAVVRDANASAVKTVGPLLTALLALVLTVGSVAVSIFLVNYPVVRIFEGLTYYRYPEGFPFILFLVLLAAALLAFAAGRPLCRHRRFTPVTLPVAAAVTAPFLYLGMTNGAHALIDYDYLVRTQQWERIISKAERCQPETPLEVSCVNLALSQTGQLTTRLFEFYQNGPQGLFPAFTRDMVSPVSTAEIFFRLGLVNDCLRYCYEAQQAIPDFQKSGRLTQRITQCEIANGNTAVARRYLAVLAQSLFYRPWAQRMQQLLDSPGAVGRDALYRRLRRTREKRTDYLCSEQEMDQLVGLLLLNDPKNHLAYEYLISYELLQRDLVKFNKYYPLGRHVGYTVIPKVVQEVLIGQWLQRHPDINSIPYSVSPDVVNETVAFIEAYYKNKNIVSLPPYCYNAWAYLLQPAPQPAPADQKSSIY